MEKILIQHPECFLSRNKKEYFEGWYYKQVFQEEGFSFSVIPGVCQNKKESFAFIQMIHSQYGTFQFEFPIDAFSYQDNPFEIKIGNNIFSKEKMMLDLEEKEFNIKGSFSFHDLTLIKTTSYAPNMMGPFAYLPFLECYHGVISLDHVVTGSLTWGDSHHTNLVGRGYIEKDSGTSFPSRYLWCQCNHFATERISLFLAIATVPIGIIPMPGHICSCYVGEKEYRFATYYASRVSQTKINEHTYEVVLTSRNHRLEITMEADQFHVLKAPTKSTMQRDIQETLLGKVSFRLWEKGKLIAKEKGEYAGIEVVNPSN